MSERILIVDDDKDFRSEFKDCFEEYGIVEAQDGREALGILKKPNEIDLVVLDYKMPGLTGIDVLKEIKKVDPKLSIILLTGHSSKDVIVEALRNRSDDFIEKPLDVDKTKKIVEKILDSKKLGEYGDTGGLKSKIEKVKRYAERNCNKVISLYDVSKAVFLSPKYLSRVFKQQTGVEFKKYFLAIKIIKAKELLEKTDYSVEEISFKLGYQNPESFIRIFEKKTGITPARYRKSKNAKSEKKDKKIKKSK